MKTSITKTGMLLAILLPALMGIDSLFAQVEVRPGTVIIKLDEAAENQLTFSRSQSGWVSTGIGSIDGLFTEFKVLEMEPVFPLNPRFEARHRNAGLHLWYVLRLESHGNELSAVSALGMAPEIRLAEPDYPIVSHEYVSIWSDPLADFLPNDPLFPDQWHYLNEGFTGGTPGADISLTEAWDLETGSPEVIVKVMDSGTAVEHPDLINMLWVNPAPGSSGKIDDFHGWNWVSNTNILDDENGHGTHVAGTVAAETNNGIGLAGVAGGDGSGNGVRIMTARIFEGEDNQSAGSNQTAAAFVYAADNGAVISNNSWGYNQPNVFPNVVRTGIDYFVDNAGYDENGNVIGAVAGGVVITSAGNNNSTNFYFPGAYERVVSVAATNHNDVKSWYSNYNSTVAMSAPGGETSQGNPFPGVYSTDIEANDWYSHKQGTSMASPHVAGVAALIASHYPGISNEELIARLVNTTDDISFENPNLWQMMGTGRLNAFRALTEDPPPGRTFLLYPEHEAEDLDLSLTLEWIEAALAETYQLQVATSEGFAFADRIVNESGLTETTFEVTGLETETTYYWRVKAWNSAGEGQWSIVRSFTTAKEVSVEGLTEIPDRVLLGQNYPNPFNPVTVIRYTLPVPSDVRLEVFTVTGQRVALLLSGMQNEGAHTISFDASDLASGVYLYRLTTGQETITRKMMLLK